METCAVCDQPVEDTKADETDYRDETFAPAQADYRGRTYYFCSTECKESFESEPGKYA